MLLGTLGASILGNMLTRKGVTSGGKDVVSAGTEHNNIYHTGKNVSSNPSFKQYQDH